MSGPVSTDDVPTDEGSGTPEVCDLEITESHTATVGAATVRRALPRRQRRTVGAWCFADHMGPAEVRPGHGIDVGPHPHIGLQTVTWLVDGEILHRDSLGSEQLIRPGQLNVMTAGHGVSHSEEGTDHRGTLEGVQLWVAQPEATRHGPAAFEHHADLPRVEVGAGSATVIVGAFDGATSPARTDTDHVGLELRLPSGPVEVPLRAECEYALVVVRGRVELAGRSIAPGVLAYLGIGHDVVRLGVQEPTTALLLGGVPFPEPIVMWWNYVGRTRAEVGQAHADWTDRSSRFGTVASPLARLDVDAPPWAQPDGDDPASAR